ncbi:MAG: peroxide stress protein YaaA [Rhodospirillales bacterium]|nr:peroxide stress protein YaaA [Rhodospirillales bacterium]
MLTVISPAKKLDFETEPQSDKFTQPEFLDETEILVASARRLTRRDLAQTMKLSDKLADLNFERFKAFSTPFTLANAKQAAHVFNGDTYIGLDAKTLNKKDMDFAQDHLRILSGLYGLLRPLDLIQPYRLEMGAKFQPPRGENLYGFWDGRLTDAINQGIAKQTDPSVINLASNEYFKAVHVDGLTGAVITPVFKEVKDGVAKVLGMFAKRARGAMARYIIKNRIEAPEKLKSFTDGGYAFQPNLSDDATWVFSREQPPPAA